MSTFMLGAMMRENQIDNIIDKNVEAFMQTLVDDTKDVIKSEMKVKGFTCEIDDHSRYYVMLKESLKNELKRYIKYSMVIP